MQTREGVIIKICIIFNDKNQFFPLRERSLITGGGPVSFFFNIGGIRLLGLTFKGRFICGLGYGEGTFLVIYDRTLNIDGTIFYSLC